MQSLLWIRISTMHVGVLLSVSHYVPPLCFYGSLVWTVQLRCEHWHPWKSTLVSRFGPAGHCSSVVNLVEGTTVSERYRSWSGTTATVQVDGALVGVETLEWWTSGAFWWDYQCFNDQMIKVVFFKKWGTFSSLCWIVACESKCQQVSTIYSWSFLVFVISQYFAIHFKHVWQNVQHAERLSIVCRALFFLFCFFCTFSGKGTKDCMFWAQPNIKHTQFLENWRLKLFHFTFWDFFFLV